MMTAVERASRALRAPGMATHLLMVGVALVLVGGFGQWLAPSTSIWWLAAAGVIVAHVGLVSVALGAVARRVEQRRRGAP